MGECHNKGSRTYRSSGRGGGQLSYAGEMTTDSGDKIEFEGSLVYGSADANISVEARATIENWEKKRVKNKIEYSYSVYPDGTPIGGEIRGSKGHVKSPAIYFRTPDAVFTHIHPRDPGILGGSFSFADMKAFSTTA